MQPQQLLVEMKWIPKCGGNHNVEILYTFKL